ncbi:hypothetical protein H7I53_17920 [Mycolicibacterium pulveris]|uniref:7-cyano-7-deazaguanine synthase n=1 Tax=Mycolicibacterium pulveris TaxID=36813 RepID=A0A7I7UBR0_MYCPV|nr:hypothetical protein [Mycolicibacterium pulveris]MCV6982095.1 hypothetical protein [Mycolicibacterium pulveris]BBY78864.1 hypothetical protein MPUL_00220 [Mycolicibacterium pulveris]
MTQGQTPPDTLLLLSGGIDSAYCLWQRVKAGLVTRTHHVSLADHEGRQAVEDRAAQRILAWMRSNGGDGLIEHSTSAMDFRTMWIPKNFHAWAYWAGVIMASPSGRSITTVILPRHADAFRGGVNSPGARASDAAYRGHIKLLCGREPKLSLPMVHLTKAQVVAEMPESLLRLCWYCRRPRGGQPCHKCMTCRQVDPALAARRR